MFTRISTVQSAKASRTARRGARGAARGHDAVTCTAGAMEPLESRVLMSTYYVSPGGDDGAAGTESAPWRTLARAASGVAEGDEVVLNAGTYAGGVTFNVPRLTVRSADGARALISSPTDNSAVQNAFRFGARAHSSTLRNVEVVGGYYYGVKLESEWGWGPAAYSVTIEDCIIHDTGRDNIKITPGCNDVIVRRTELYNSGLRDNSNAEGIDNVNGDRMLVQDCYIHDIATTGVYAKGGAIGAVIERNRIERTGSLGVSLGFTTDSEFFDPSDNPESFESVDGIVRNNVIVSSTYAGIGLYSALRPLVYNNTLVNVAGSGQAGILMAPGWEYNPSNQLVPSRDVTIRNNVVWVSGNAPWVQIREDGLTGSITMSHNRYHRAGGTSTATAFRDDRGGTRWTGDLSGWQARVNTDADSAVANPVLDAAAGYRLAAGSPLVDAGMDLSAAGFSDDLDRQARPAGGGWDIGADELGAVPAPNAPAAPSGLTATAAAPRRVNLTWADNAANETGFRIERRAAGGAWGQVGTVGVNTTTFADTAANPSTAYEYRVRAYNAGGDSPNSTTASATTPADTTGGGGGGGGGGEDGTLLGSFGTINGRRTKLAFADGDGTAVVATLGGGGTAEVYLMPDGRLSVRATGTGVRSALALKARGGADGRIVLGDGTISGALRSFKADRADLSGTFAVAGPLGTLTLGTLTGGTVAVAGPALAVSVRGAVTNGRVLAGVGLGADGELGGGDDQAVGGLIRKVNVLGAVAGSVFAAGALPGANGTYGDGDDVLTGGTTSSILSVSTRGNVDAASRFVGGAFGRAAKLGLERVVPASDARFVTLT